MSLRPVIITSACANVALIAFLALRAPTTPVESRSSQAANGSKATSPETVTNTVEVELPPETRRIDWHSVESADFKEYIVRLRAVQCPNETIRDIIIADVNKLYASKWKTLMKPEGGVRYWDPWDGAAEYFDRNVAGQRRALEKERNDLVRELLGVDLDGELRKQQMSWTEQDREDVMLSFLSEEKLHRLREIRGQAAEMNRVVFEKYRLGGTAIKPEDNKELTRIKEWERTELQKLLTPQEYDMYVVRASDLARSLRMELAAFEPTEAEYLTLVRYRAGTETASVGPISDPEKVRALLEERKKAMEFLQQTLGPERYAEYRRSTDYNYQEILRFTQTQNLPKTTATQVYEIQNAMQQQTRKLLTDAAIAPDARQAAQLALQQEARKAVQALLTPEAYKAYTASQGRWLQMGPSMPGQFVPPPR